MLTLKRRRRRRVPPQRGRGAILGLFFCCAQCSMLAVGVSRDLAGSKNQKITLEKILKRFYSLSVQSLHALAPRNE
jgi:hypothetical protein